MKQLTTGLGLLLMAATGTAQDIQFPARFEELAKKASEVVNITLDSSMLAAAARSAEQKPEKATKAELLRKLRGIYIRSYKFDQPGQYSKEDVEAIRAQLQPPDWVPVVSVRARKANKEEADIYVKKSGDQIVGLTIVAAEPKELTVVHILGPIQLNELGNLGGALKIPQLHFGPRPPEQPEPPSAEN